MWLLFIDRKHRDIFFSLYLEIKGLTTHWHTKLDSHAFVLPKYMQNFLDIILEFYTSMVYSFMYITLERKENYFERLKTHT